MIINYKIGENDFLTHQLYIASKSDRIKKKRNRNKLITPLIYVAFSIYFFLDEEFFIAIIFFIIGLLWFLTYPFWDRKNYIKHYRGFIKENYKGRINIESTLEFSNEYIIAKSNGSESKVLTSEIEKINEIPMAIYLRLKGGQSFILPKDNINNIDIVIKKLKELADYLKIKYETEEKWEWK